MRGRYILVLLLLISVTSFAQTSIKEAYVLTRMMDKFHVQPKPLNDSFSAIVFDAFFEKADPCRIFFTKEDIQELSTFRYQLDNELQQQRSQFLPAVTSIYRKRIRATDSLIATTAKEAFVVSVRSLEEKDQRSERPSAKEQRAFLSRFVHAAILSQLMDEVLTDRTMATNKKLLDSTEKAERQVVVKKLRRNFQLMLNGPSSIEEIMNDIFCSSIAEIYDPHSSYFSMDRKREFEHSLGNKDLELGVALDEGNNGEVKIGKIRPGSSAFRTGKLSEGDQIKAIKWEEGKIIDFSDTPIEEIRELLSAKKDRPITLVVKKADGSIQDVTLMHSKADGTDEDKVKGFLLKDKRTVGYISLPVFYSDWENGIDQNVQGCANDVAKEIIKLKKENIDALILDLRYNGGGSLQEATELAGIFIDGGPVAQVKGSDSKPFILKDGQRGTIYDGPLFVLVNHYSASASEYLAAILQDHRRAIIVGSNTFGKATSQLVLPLDTLLSMNVNALQQPARSFVKVTMRTLYRLTGESFQGRGIIPDIELPELLERRMTEASQPMHLSVSPIAANTFYKPSVPQFIINDMIVKEEIANEKAFSRISKLKALKEGSRSKIASMELQGLLVLFLEMTDLLTEKNKDNRPSFTVDMPSLTKEREAADPAARIMNDAIRAGIAADPQITTLFRIFQRTPSQQ